MPDNKYCTSISESPTFQTAAGEHINCEVRRARMRTRNYQDEQALRVRLADAAVDASYAALVAVIDAYCAEKMADLIHSIRLVDGRPERDTNE